MSHNPEPAKAAAPRTTETTTPARRTVLSLGAGTVAGLGAVVTLSACGSSDPAATASSAAAGVARLPEVGRTYDLLRHRRWADALALPALPSSSRHSSAGSNVPVAERRLAAGRAHPARP